MRLPKGRQNQNLILGLIFCHIQLLFHLKYWLDYNLVGPGQKLVLMEARWANLVFVFSTSSKFRRTETSKKCSQSACPIGILMKVNYQNLLIIFISLDNETHFRQDCRLGSINQQLYQHQSTCRGFFDLTHQLLIVFHGNLERSKMPKIAIKIDIPLQSNSIFTQDTSWKASRKVLKKHSYSWKYHQFNHRPLKSYVWRLN